MIPPSMSTSECVYKESRKGHLYGNEAPTPWKKRFGWNGFWGPFKIKTSLCGGLNLSKLCKTFKAIIHQSYKFNDPLKVLIQCTDFAPFPDFLWWYRGIGPGFISSFSLLLYFKADALWGGLRLDWASRDMDSGLSELLRSLPCSILLWNFCFPLIKWKN